MAGNQELFEALQMFQQGVQQAATSNAVLDATANMQQINSQITDEAQKRQALDQLSRYTALRLTGAGANGSQIQAAFNSIAPQQFGSAEQMQLEGMASGNQFLTDTSSKIIGERRKAAIDQLKLQNQLEMKRDQAKFDNELTLQGMKNAAKIRGAKVPGMILEDPSVELSPVEIKELRNGVRDFSSVMDTMAKIDELTADVGTESFSAFSNKSGKLKSLQTKLLLQLKSPNMENLGVLQKIDLDTIEGMIGDPTALLTSGGQYRERLGTFKETLASQMHAAATARGFRLDPKFANEIGIGGMVPGTTQVETRTLRDGTTVQVQYNPITGKYDRVK